MKNLQHIEGEGMHLSPAEFVIYVFGGVRATARALNKAPSSVCKWQAQGLIPSQVQRKILDVASERNLQITPSDLILGREMSKSEFVDGAHA